MMMELLIGFVLGAVVPGTARRRWLCALGVLMILAPASGRAAGSLTIPNVIANQSGPNLAASLLDSNWSAVATYVNNREIASGTLGARPAASISGRWYFANDQNGGTLYFDTGSAWTQVSPGITNNGVTNQLASLTLSNDATNPNTIVDIAAGAAASDDATIANRIMMTLTSAMTKNVSTAWAVGTGNGCLDTGSIGANKTYWIYVIERTDTAVVDVLCSLAASTPTLPASYNKQRRIGAVMTQNNNNLVVFTQFGRYFRLATSVLDVNTSNPGTSAVTATVSVPNGDSVVWFGNTLVTSGASPATPTTITLPTIQSIALSYLNSYTHSPTIRASRFAR